VETLIAANPVRLGRAQVRSGASSWADKGLTHESDFYPRRTMKAAERLAYYASRLSLAEITGTERFPPTPDVARQWVERTPDGFMFDVRAWSLFTGAPTMPDSLFEDLRDEVRPETRDHRRLYATHLSTAAVDECWARFRHALEPLVAAGRLGVVLFTYPSWFTPKDETKATLVEARERLGDLTIAVEFRSPKWTLPDTCEDTLAFLEDEGLAYVSVDRPADSPPVIAATAEMSVVRFLGRRRDEEEPWWPWPYRYSHDELAGFVPHVRELAESSAEVHLIFSNIFRDDAVRGALQLNELVAR
jgi:uncharacterized protein YecE (DUF72 family)